MRSALNKKGCATNTFNKVKKHFTLSRANVPASQARVRREREVLSRLSGFHETPNQWRSINDSVWPILFRTTEVALWWWDMCQLTKESLILSEFPSQMLSSWGAYYTSKPFLSPGMRRSFLPSLNRRMKRQRAEKIEAWACWYSNESVHIQFDGYRPKYWAGRKGSQGT